MKTNNQIEILSPVGSYESLMAAVQAKTDAIYFGIEKINMRAKSTANFTIDDLQNIVNICKKENIKTYLTLNTVIYENEMDKVKEILIKAKEHSVDAVIASDFAVINFAKEIKMPVHLSTQVNISNIEAVKFFAQLADVVVLARELSLEQVKAIADDIEKQNIRGVSGELMKLEIFVHGALCMAISGKCYLSLHENNHSANKGQCLQTCRKAYTVKEKESNYELDIDNEYIMSPKDLCTIDFIDKIVNSGVKLLKIEGRARSPEYVKTTTECYKEAANSVINGTYNQQKIEIWKKRLESVFNRGFWDGYYLGKKIGEWTNNHGSIATKKKIYIAKGVKYFKNIQVAEFVMQTGELSIGEEILIIGPTTGVIETKIEQIQVELQNVEKVMKGQNFSIKIKEQIRPSDKMYKLVSNDL